LKGLFQYDEIAEFGHLRERWMRRIGIVGAGQSGLQLGLGLLKYGYDVVLLSNQTPEQIETGRVTSSQCMFGSAIRNEQDLGIDFWQSAPKVDGIQFTLAPSEGRRAFEWASRLDLPAQSIDQRVKMPMWIREFCRLGGDFRVVDAGIPELEVIAKECELVVVASGKGEVGKLFERDVEKSPFDRPMRALGLTYVKGLRPRQDYSAVCFNLIPGVGEYFVFPALTTNGPCEIMVFEGIPEGPMDCWRDVKDPQQHLEVSTAILKRFLPWEYERCQSIRLTDSNGVLSGRFPPTVRNPVATLPSGKNVLGVGDTVCLNDPITGQGSNNASKCAAVYLQSILRRDEGGPFDTDWMQKTFNEYWEYAQFVVGWTNSMLLPPPPHVVELLAAAVSKPDIASWFVNAFDDPRRFFPHLANPAEARALIANSKAA
jgi:hypothetical protein